MGNLPADADGNPIEGAVPGCEGLGVMVGSADVRHWLRQGEFGLELVELVTPFVSQGVLHSLYLLGQVFDRAGLRIQTDECYVDSDRRGNALNIYPIEELA